LCHLQHKLVGFYNRDEKCLQRGTDWVFKYSSLRFVFKGLILGIRVVYWGTGCIKALLIDLDVKAANLETPILHKRRLL